MKKKDGQQKFLFSFALCIYQFPWQFDHLFWKSGTKDNFFQDMSGLVAQNSNSQCSLGFAFLFVLSGFRELDSTAFRV